MKADSEPVFKTIDEYLGLQSDPAKSLLVNLRQVIKQAAPEAVEGISYRMPVFKYHGMLAYFAAFTNHYSLFVTPEVLQAFTDRLSGFTTTKSAIHFPFDQPVQEKLVTEIIGYAKNLNLNREALKAEAKKKKNTKK